MFRLLAACANLLCTNQVDDMRWIGHESSIVLAKTKLGIVFRSIDGGRNWKRLGPDKENKVTLCALCRTIERHSSGGGNLDLSL